jgi:Zn-dependent peptidase ImmA (M78 family)
VCAAHHSHRRRFSIARELGHATLRHASDHYVDNWGEDAWEPQLPLRGRARSKPFTAALLMEDRAIRRDFANGIQDVHQLVDRYQVSEDAMNYGLIVLT